MILKRILLRIYLHLSIIRKTGRISIAKNYPPNPKESDVYLVSYPKSGNTWMRYLLAYAIWPELESIDLKTMASYIPSVNLDWDNLKMLDIKAPCNNKASRIIKNHFRYEKGFLFNNKVIFIVRDGRDALVSYWYFTKQRDNIDISFSKFLETPQPYGPWRDYVIDWMNAPINKLVVRYEDMLLNPRIILNNVLDFININCSEEIIENAVEKASFKSLKKIEDEKGLNIDQLKKVNFIRKGKTGSWKDIFKEGDIERFNKFHGGPIPELGYIW